MTIDLTIGEFMICQEICIAHVRQSERPAAGPAVSILIALVIVTITVSAVVAAHSVQGSSDQFWYLSDVASLSHHSALSNNVFPATAGNSVGGRPMFIHNNLSLYLVGILAKVLSPNAAWIYSNLICTLGAGIFLFHIVRSFVDDEMALLTSAIFLCFPLAVWQSCNALSECQHALVIAGATWAMLCLRRGVRRTTLVVGFLSAAALMKDNLLYVAVVYMAIDLVSEGYSRSAPSRSVIRRVVRLALSYLTVLALCILMKGTLFHENADFTLSRRLATSAMPYRDTMFPYFFPKATVPSVHVLALKVSTNLRQQLWPAGKEMVFAFPINLLIICSFTGISRKRRWASPLLLMSCGCVAVYLMTTLLYQNEFRYALFTLPVMLSAAVLVLSKTVSRSMLRKSAMWLIVLQLAVCPLLLKRVRDRAREQAPEIAEIRARMLDIPESVPVLFEADPTRYGSFMLFSYAVSPRRVVVIRGGDFACLQYSKVKPYLTGDFVVASYDDKLLGLVGSSAFELVSPELRAYRIMRPTVLCKDKVGNVALNN